MSATPTSVGVVVQVTTSTDVRTTLALWQGAPGGSLELGVGQHAGASIVFADRAALLEVIEVLHRLDQQLLDAQDRATAEQRALEEEDAWALATELRGGRPPLRAVSPDDVVAASEARLRHTSYAGALA